MEEEIMGCFIKVEIYTKDDCMWCERAKEFLNFNRIIFTEYKVTPKNIAGIKDTYPEASTVPIILVDGKWIGGYEDMINLAHEEGWLLA
jgi:glutaredoxin